MLLIIGLLVLALCQQTQDNSGQIVESENFLDLTNSPYYFDKSGLIAGIIDDAPVAILITRPRRWGKTLSLSMLKYFFTNAPDSNGNPQVPNPYLNYFQGGECLRIVGDKRCDQLAISKLPRWDQVYKLHQGRYPVILLTFKSLQIGSFKDFKDFLKTKILMAYVKFKYIMQDQQLNSEYQFYFNLLSSPEDLQNILIISLLELTELVYKFHKQRVILLIDEYDQLIVSIVQDSSQNNNVLTKEHHRIIQFYNDFLSESIKSNDNLYKCVLTGIFDSLMKQGGSGLNSVEVNTILSEMYQQFYGLQLSEIEEKLELIETSTQNKLYMLGNITQWYNGYENPNGGKLYSSLSVIKYIQRFIKSQQLKPQNYWGNTGALKLIDYLRAIGDSTSVYNMLQAIIDGEQIVVKQLAAINYFSIIESQSIIFTDKHLAYVLIHYGYLTCKGDEQQLKCYQPNNEVRTQLILEFSKLLGDDQISKENSLVQEIKSYIKVIKPYWQIYKAILENNIEQISEIFTQHSNINCNTYDKMNLLSLAAIQGNDSVIASIIDNCHYSDQQLVPIDQSGLSVQDYAFYGQASAETIEQLTKISAKKVSSQVLTILDYILCMDETIPVAQRYYPRQFIKFLLGNDYASYYLISYAKKIIKIYKQDSICAHLQHEDAVRTMIQEIELQGYMELSLLPCTTSTIRKEHINIFEQDQKNYHVVYMCRNQMREQTQVQHQFQLWNILINLILIILVIWALCSRFGNQFLNFAKWLFRKSISLNVYLKLIIFAMMASCFRFRIALVNFAKWLFRKSLLQYVNPKLIILAILNLCSRFWNELKFAKLLFRKFISLLVYLKQINKYIRIDRILQWLHNYQRRNQVQINNQVVPIRSINTERQIQKRRK